MSKSILILDTPKECWDCPLHIESYDDDFEDIMICNAKKLESHYGEIPNYCPLKPLPQKIEELSIEETIVSNKYNSTILLEKAIKKAKQRGYNECLDEILGGEQ